MSDPAENIEDAQGVVQTIMLWRIYDVLLLLLRQTNRPMADQLVEIHEKGEFVGPNPSYVQRGSDD
jgi:hypothetical protein